jgi:hypothetical protein
MQETTSATLVPGADKAPRRSPSGQRLSAFVAACEAWRQSLRMSHTEFVRLLGRDQTEWANMRAGRRSASETFVRAVRDEVRRRGGEWPSILERAYAVDTMRGWHEPWVAPPPAPTGAPAAPSTGPPPGSLDA